MSSAVLHCMAACGGLSSLSQAWQRGAGPWVSSTQAYQCCMECFNSSSEEKKVKNSSINYIKILTQCFKNPVFSFFPLQSYPLTKIFFVASFIWIPVSFQRKEESPDMAYYLRYRSYFLSRTLTFWLPLSFLTSYGFSK